MENLFQILIPIALFAVAAIILAGLWTVMRGGNPRRSQRLMRWRVALQFIAIILIIGAVYVAGR